MAQVQGKRLIVLGGGLSGLSFVHYARNFAAALNKNAHINRITLLESNDYMGGSVKTKIFDDGMLHELGPRSIRVAGVRAQNTVALLEQLGLADKVLPIVSGTAAAQNRFIYNKGKLHKLPASLGGLFSKLPGAKSTLGAAVFKDVALRPKMNLEHYPDQDPSLYEFIKYRFGEDAAECVLDPMMRGIAAGDARKLSTRALFGDFIEKEQAYGSVLKGVFKPPVTKMTHDELFPHDVLDSKLLDRFQKQKVVSYNLSTGLQCIPEYLSNALLNTNDDGVISIFNQTKVKSLEFNARKDGFENVPCLVEVETLDGDRVKLEADHVIAAIPAKQLAQILPTNMTEQQRKAFDIVTSIPHSPVGCVCVEYRDLNSRPKLMDSFGLLTHSKAGSRVLGIAFDSSMFPAIDKPFNSARMTAMIGGSWFKEIFGTDDTDRVSDAQMEQIALEEIGKLVGIKAEPHRMSTLLWKTGIAQYTPGHKGRLQEARRILKEQSVPLTLIGQSYDGIAINDVVFTARMAAHEFVKSL